MESSTSTSTYIASLLILCCLISHTQPQDATKKIGKIKPPTPKTPNTIINDATGEELVQIIDEHQHVAVLFYDKLDKKTQRVLSQMEDMETEDLDVSIVRYKAVIPIYYIFRSGGQDIIFRFPEIERLIRLHILGINQFH